MTVAETDQIPHGPENRDCPLWKEAMSLHCHKCPLWSNVQGKDPQGDIVVNRWHCALYWNAHLQTDNTQHLNQLSAAVESLRNRFAELIDSVREGSGLTRLPYNGHDDIRTIEHKPGD